MTISIDGKTYKGGKLVRYSDGDGFPRRYRSIEVDHPEYGLVLIYITLVGTPEWVDPLTVRVPIEYYITEVLKPNLSYVKKRRLQKSGLKLIEG